MQRKLLEVIMAVLMIAAVWILSQTDIRIKSTYTGTKEDIDSNSIYITDEQSINNDIYTDNTNRQERDSKNNNSNINNLNENDLDNSNLDKSNSNNSTENSYTKTVVIDPGHGGMDSGKVGINGRYEKEINLEISIHLKEYLEKEGFKVYLTRDSDSGLYLDSDSNKKASDMKKRCDIIYSEKADIAVSIHQNSFTDEAVRGAQVFFYTHSEEGKKLANIIQESIKNIADPDNTRTEKANDSYYMLINTKCPTVIVECGFLSNREEADRLSQEEYQILIAKAIGEGIKAYTGEMKY